MWSPKTNRIFWHKLVTMHRFFSQQVECSLPIFCASNYTIQWWMACRSSPLPKGCFHRVSNFHTLWLCVSVCSLCCRCEGVLRFWRLFSLTLSSMVHCRCLLNLFSFFVWCRHVTPFCSNASIALARSLCKYLLAVLITASEADTIAGFIDSWCQAV